MTKRTKKLYAIAVKVDNGKDISLILTYRVAYSTEEAFGIYYKQLTDQAKYAFSILSHVVIEIPKQYIIDNLFSNTSNNIDRQKLDSFLEHTRSNWTTDKDGNPALLMDDVLTLVNILTQKEYTKEELLTEKTK